MSTIILHASSRSDGNTTVIANYLAQTLQTEAINLSAHEIAPFSYEDDYAVTDEYIPIIEKIMAYDHWILVTPVYWYTMSAQMKTFMDRLSDLVRYRLDLGEAAKGKTLWAVSCGSTAEPIPHFFTPFELSAGYMKMKYGGDLHAWLGRVPLMKPEVQVLLDEFCNALPPSPPS